MKKKINRIKDISIARKLYFIVGTMAVLILLELLTLGFSIRTLSAVRALVGAEGLWSKAEKDAAYSLNKYYRTQDEKDYENFLRFIAVPMGDHNTRLELLKANPDREKARQGFIEGRVPPEDIDGMIRVLRRFHNISYINRAVSLWTQGDSMVMMLVPIAAEMRRQVQTQHPSQPALDSLIGQVDRINEQVTELEDNFSYTLGEGSRRLEHLILRVLFCVALIVEITGLTLSILVTRNIKRGLQEIITATDKIRSGDLTARAPVFSRDEIGRVAIATNQMAEQLILSNQELINFAYIASHDLQEPMRKISVFISLLENECKDTISEKGKNYMERIIKSSNRMRQLIEDILQLSRLNADNDLTTVNLNEVLAEVISDMELVFTKKNAILTHSDLPAIEANAAQMHQLFQNLLSNSIKFNNGQPQITVSYEETDGTALPKSYWQAVFYKLPREDRFIRQEKFYRISVKDNGIGFDEKYLERIFIIFQRLNGKHLYEGSGIGLAVCHKIVENHHGIITAHSTSAEGATFIITLPAVQKNFNPGVRAIH